MSKRIVGTNISFSYENTKVIDDVTFEINEGDFVAFCGQNGTGKSTLLKIIAKINKPTSGTIRNDFKKVSYLSQLNMNKKNFFLFSVEEIVSLGIKKAPLSFLNKDNKAKIEAWMKNLNIYDLRKKRFDEISGGEQERTRLAECLISEPDLLLLDEPSSGLDFNTRQEIFDLLEKLHNEKKTTIIVVSHDKDEISKCSRFMHFTNNMGIEVNHHHD
ncbi:MAG: metal ABC transporter ATP-binding protein [Bacilli bacterium]|nr:metal ABC transporter ATP-binding protein [Bacilli bacterium]